MKKKKEINGKRVTVSVTGEVKIEDVPVDTEDLKTFMNSFRRKYAKTIRILAGR